MSSSFVRNLFGFGYALAALVFNAMGWLSPLTPSDGYPGIEHILCFVICPFTLFCCSMYLFKSRSLQSAMLVSVMVWAVINVMLMRVW